MKEPTSPLPGGISGLRTRLESHQQAVEIVIGGMLAGYLVYLLMLSKLFSPSIDANWFRDLGILWNLSDYVFEHRDYQIGQYYFPPSNAILIHAYGLMNRELAFRAYVLMQTGCLVLVLWMWSRFLGIDRRPDRALIVLTAFLAAHFYVRFELHMQNLNLVTLCLVSAAVLHPNRASGFFYALALALKPYSSVLVLPWMAWQRYYRWAAHALVWLIVFFGVLPVVCFGFSDTVTLYRGWIASLALGGTEGATDISLRPALAAMLGAPIADPRVTMANIIVQGTWIVVLVLFFLPTLLRRGPGSARAMAAEFAAIMLSALPLGAHQQPARGVVLLVATLVVSQAAFSRQRSAETRAALFGVLAFVAISTHLVPVGPWHFLLTLPVCLASLLGLALARRDPVPIATTAGFRA